MVSDLPEPVQKYIKYVGANGKPKVRNFKIELIGNMQKDAQSPPMRIESVQHNFVKNPVRMFYIKGSLMGIPVYGLHAYKDEVGIMMIRVLGLFPVVDTKGREMDLSDTVTLLNDMCIFAPATLIDQRIQWTNIDELTVKAIFTNGTQTVSATLFFNETGQLINFISDDRYRIDKQCERLRWSTPVNVYKRFGDLNLSAKASTVWHYPDGAFTYGDFDVVDVVYNVMSL